MFLPIRDSPNPPGVPVVTYALIAANVLVFLLVTVPLGAQPLESSLGGSLPGAPSRYDALLYEYGYVPAFGTALTLLTSMFLHGGLMHLAGNMLFLWIYGDNVEARLGRVVYLLSYLGSGACATLFFSAFDSASEVPLVGASGAISGVLGFYFVLFPRNVVHVAILLFPIFMNVVQIRARFVLGFYLIVDNLLPVLAAQGSNVAYGAHIGGFLAGAAGAWLFGGRPEKEGEADPKEARPVQSPRPFGRPRSVVPSDQAFSRLLRNGRYEEAAKLYFRLDESELDPSSSESLELGRWLADHGHPQAALTLFRRVLSREPTGSLAAWAHLGAGYVQVQFLDRRTAGYQHLLEAIDCDPSGDAAARARSAIDQLGTP